MANSGQQFVALLGGFMRGMMSADMQRKQKEFEQTRKEKEISPMMQIFLDIAGNVKEPPQNRQQAMEQAMLLQQQEQLAAQPQKPTRQPGVIEPGYGWRSPEALGVPKPAETAVTGKKEGIPGMTFVAPEEEKKPSERMTTVAKEKPISKKIFPSFEGAMRGDITKHGGMIGGLTEEEKARGIKDIAIDEGITTEKTDQFLKDYGFAKGKAEEPELTLTQFMDRYARADDKGKKRLKELFPQYEQYAVEYKYHETGLPLEFHEKAREIQRLRSVIDEYDNAIKSSTFGKTERPFPGREKEVERLKKERQQYVDKMKSIKFYGEDIESPPELPEGLPGELPRTGKSLKDPLGLGL